MGFFTWARAIWKLDWRCAGARARCFSSRVGTAHNNAGVAGRNAAADGARLSSRHAERAAGQSGGGAADRDGRTSGISDTGLRPHLTRSGKTTRGAADMGDDAARAHRAVVCAISSMELSHSWAASMVGCSVSFDRCAPRGDGTHDLLLA